MSITGIHSAPRGLERERRNERLRQEPGDEQTIEHPIELLAQLSHHGIPQCDSHLISSVELHRQSNTHPMSTR